MEANQTNASQSLTNCPLCGRHCPLSTPGCERGKALAEKLKNGETVDLEELRAEHREYGDRTHGEREHHGERNGERKHGHHRGGRHGAV